MKIVNFKIILILLTSILFFGCSSKEVSAYSTLKQIELPSKNYSSSRSKDAKLSFATINPMLNINFNVSKELQKALVRRLKNNFNRLSCKMPTEIKKILISKGITVTDNYWNRSDMTFSQKRDTSTLFYPVIQIDIEQNTLDTMRQVDDEKAKKTKTIGKLYITTKVELISLEPLSGEKIWLKSLPIKRKNFTIDIAYDGELKASSNGFSVDRKVENITEEIDSLTIEIYNKIIEGVDKYVDYDEFIFLNKDIEKIKNIKRY